MTDVIIVNIEISVTRLFKFKRRSNFMMDMILNSGKFVIDDKNQVQVDSVIAEKINKGFKDNEDNKDKKEPSFTILDVKD